MTSEPRVPKLPDLPVRSVAEMGLKELERIRLILRGGSVIEWRRLHFKSREEVDRFLRLCQLDPDDAHDQEWVRTILGDAVRYLRSEFNYRVADAVAKPKEIHELFLYAARILKPHRYQKIACIVLKVMHVIQHLEGRDVIFKLAIAEEWIQQLVTARVHALADEMREKGLPVIEFVDSIKARDSLITKLLAKKDTVAAQIYDKIRFRIVTRSKEDILPVLYFMTQRLFPFNFVVPNQTENSLLSFQQVLLDHPNFARHAGDLQIAHDYEDRRRGGGRNKFSGTSYRSLNFVVDLPIRLDAFLPPPDQDPRPRKARIGFGLVEFQIMDQQTAQQNERGENSHDQYKARQKSRVLRRLSRGLVVPKSGRRRNDSP